MALYTAVQGNMEHFFNVQNKITIVIQAGNGELSFRHIPRRMKKQELDETFNLDGAKLSLISVSEFEEMLRRVKHSVKISLGDQLKTEPEKPGFLDA